MEQPTIRTRASDFHPEVLRLFDQYVHGLLDRRGFLERASRYALAGATAATFLEALSPKFARAQRVAPTDARLHSEFVVFDSPRGNGKGRGYLVRPAQPSGKLPVVLVIHENRGLNPHIEDIARRVALENFIAFAPDALFGLGGYPGDEDRARELFQKLDKPRTFEDFVAAAEFAQRLPESNNRLGAVGFCYGGGVAHQLAVRLPNLRAAVPFYGTAPAADEAAQVKAELLVHLAENDERVNASWPPYEVALKVAQVKFRVSTYPGTQHGFHNDTTPRFDETAAKLAWQRTLELFNRTLRPSSERPSSHPAPRP